MNQSLVAVGRDEILRRMRTEFLEMPGLCLTCAQAGRLWALDAQTCASALASLTCEHFLHLRSDGTYGRLPDCGVAFAPLGGNFSRPAAKNSRSGR